MKQPRFVIVVDAPTSAERDRVHESIKESTGHWWHELKDVWIVTGHNARYWRDRLNPLVRGHGSKLIVLKLSEGSSGRWAHGGRVQGLQAWFDQLT